MEVWRTSFWTEILSLRAWWALESVDDENAFCQSLLQNVLLDPQVLLGERKLWIGLGSLDLETETDTHEMVNLTF